MIWTFRGADINEWRRIRRLGSNPRPGAPTGRGCCIAFLVGAAIALAASPVAAQQLAWIDAAGKPLTFPSRGQAAEFLRTADVLSMETLPVGVTAPRKTLLEQGDVRVNAIFRDVDSVNTRVRLDDGTFHARLRDSATFEVAAYRMALLLGIDSVPPAVRRTVSGRDGSMQLWVENATSGTERLAQGVVPSNYRDWVEQYRRLEIFDLVIGNVDRNSGNYLVDGTGKLWLIDHTRAFQTFIRDWSPRGVAFIDRPLWERLRDLDRTALDENLGDLLNAVELNQLWQRLEDVVEHVHHQIELRGEEQVVLAVVQRRRSSASSTAMISYPVVISMAR